MQTPPRPAITPELKHSVADTLIDIMVARGTIAPGKRGLTTDRIETLAGDIAAAWRPGMDGAALAAALQACRGWGFITTGVTIALDSFNTMLYEALADHVRDWVQAYAITARHAPGDAIQYRNLTGTVVATDPAWPATYRISLTHTTAGCPIKTTDGGPICLRVPFEDVTAISTAKRAAA